MVKKCRHYNIGIGKIATEDRSFLLQIVVTLIVVLAGILLELNVIQWGMIAMLTSVFLFTGLYRNAAHLVTIYDDNITRAQAVRIKAMSNLIVVVTAGMTFFAYLLIFVPKINQLL
jgi:diacylglycerol kinase